MREAPSQLPLRLIVLLTLAHISFGGSRLAITLQAVHLQASPFTIGVIMSLLMVVPIFISVSIGRWADRAGYARPAMLGLALLAAAGVLCAALPMLAVLGIASVLLGTGFMVAQVAVNNAIGNASTPATRAQAFGLMAMGFSFSGFVGPLIAGFMVDYLTHAMAFIGLMLFPVMAALLLAGSKRQQGAVRPAQPSVDDAHGSVMDLLRHPPLRPVFILTALVSMGWDLFLFLMPLYSVRCGLSPSEVGMVAGAFGAGSFAVRTATAWLMRLVDEWRLFAVALGLTAASYIAVPFYTSLQALLPLSFILGMTLGCGQPIGMSLLHATSPPGRTGEAFGVRSTITSFSQTGLPLLFGALGSALGMMPVFFAVAVVLGAGGAYSARQGKVTH